MLQADHRIQPEELKRILAKRTGTPIQMQALRQLRGEAKGGAVPGIRRASASAPIGAKSQTCPRRAGPMKTWMPPRFASIRHATPLRRRLATFSGSWMTRVFLQIDVTWIRRSESR